jgi:L-serine deaminase
VHGGEASDTGAEGVDIADVASETEEDLEESLANGADDTFESDIDFMTKVISGGLNKQKSTGQTTIPVVSTQVNRLGSPMKESTDLLHDWRKLSGIK